VHLIVVSAFPGSQWIAVISSESELGVHYGVVNMGILIGVIWLGMITDKTLFYGSMSRENKYEQASTKNKRKNKEQVQKKETIGVP